MPGAPSGKRVLVQRATENAFNIIVAPSASYTDVNASVQFKPIAGKMPPAAFASPRGVTNQWC